MVIVFSNKHIVINNLWIDYINGGVIFRKVVKSGEDWNWKSAHIYDRIYAIHIHATGMEVSKP